MDDKKQMYQEMLLILAPLEFVRFREAGSVVWKYQVARPYERVMSLAEGVWLGRYTNRTQNNYEWDREFMKWWRGFCQWGWGLQHDA